MSEKLSTIEDLSNAASMNRVIAHIRQLKGMHRIEICKYRPRRTDRQNRYYWPCFVKKFAEYLIAEGNELSDPEEFAHGVFRERFLTVWIDDPTLGRLSRVRSTTELNTVEFNEFLDHCAAMLADVGITVDEPGVYHEPPDEEEDAEAEMATVDYLT